LVLCLFMFLGAVWNISNLQRRALEELREKSEVIAQQFLSLRTVMAKNQVKINYDSYGNFEFKHLNPAAVGQQVNKDFNSRTDYSIKQTRFKVRNPDNEPDAFERKKLKQFAANGKLKALWGEDVVKGKRVFRYMVPLYAEQACLECHGEPAGTKDVSGYPREGLKPGELAGAISITSPMDAVQANIRETVFEYVVLTLLIIGVTGGLIDMHSWWFITKPLRRLMGLVAKVSENPGAKVSFEGVKGYGEIKDLANAFGAMAQRLEESYSNLEKKVAERTWQLSLANENLRFQRQELQRINDELAKVSSYKSQFLANMSHELRTPLTSILAFTEMLLKKMPGDLTDEQEEYLRDIYDSGTQLMNLINDILDLSKIEAGRMSLKPEEVDLKETVQQVCRVLKPLVNKKDQHLEINIPVGLTVMGDREKICQILMNLCGNATKFTPEGGNIRVTARELKGVGKAAIAVADNGIGIEEEFLPLIFEQFKQLDSSMSREHHGTGLGLALVKKLVELHGGDLEVESRPGYGSIFTFTLPVARAGEG